MIKAAEKPLFLYLMATRFAAGRAEKHVSRPIFLNISLRTAI